MMSWKTDWAWLAGLFDGEGCIFINRQRAATRKDLRRDSFRLFTTVVMGHLITIEKCLKISQLGTIQRHQRAEERINASHTWMCAGRQAAKVIQIVQPYLVTKAEEASIALAFAAMKPWLRGGRDGNPPKSLEYVKQELRFYWQLRIAKPRWRFYAAKLKIWQREELEQLDLELPKT